MAIISLCEHEKNKQEQRLGSIKHQQQEAAEDIDQHATQISILFSGKLFHRTVHWIE